MISIERSHFIVCFVSFNYNQNMSVVRWRQTVTITVQKGQLCLMDSGKVCLCGALGEGDKAVTERNGNDLRAHSVIKRSWISP